jgi:ABC-type glycerol-3-phosphate transport system substrate-binding protein
MRRIAVVVGLAALLSLAACSTSSGSGSDSGADPNDPSATTIVTSNPITGPAEQARNVVGQQNAQLQQEQQQTGG